MQSRLLSNSICVNWFTRAFLCVMVYLISITTTIILYNISLLFSHTVHLSTACPFSTPPYFSPPPPSALHPSSCLYPEKSRPTWEIPTKHKINNNPHSVGQTQGGKESPKQAECQNHPHTHCQEYPLKTKPTTYQICGGPVTNPCRISVSLHEHCWADASSVLSWCLQPLCIPFLLLVPGILWSLSVGTGWKPPNWVFSFFCGSLHLLPSASSGSPVDHHWTKQL